MLADEVADKFFNLPIPLNHGLTVPSLWAGDDLIRYLNGCGRTRRLYKRGECYFSPALKKHVRDKTADVLFAVDCLLAGDETLRKKAATSLKQYASALQ